MLTQLAAPELLWDVPDPVEVDPYVPDVVPPSWLLAAPTAEWEVPAGCCVEPPESPLDPNGLIGWAVPGVPRGENPPALPEVGELISRLQATVAELTVVSPVDVPAPQALAEQKALLGIEQALRLHQLDRVADVHLRKLHQLESFGSASAWLKSQTTDVQTADVALAKKLHRYPVLRASLHAQQLSLAGAKKLAIVLDKLAKILDRQDGLIDGLAGEQVLAGVLGEIAVLVCECTLALNDDDPRLLALSDQLAAIASSGNSQLGQVEAGFVLLACQVEPAQLSSCLDRLWGALLPSTLADNTDAAEAERGVELYPSFDGSGARWVADLTPETSELLHLLLDAEMRRDPANPDDTAASADHRALGALGADGPAPDRRTLRQRRHDAFHNLLSRYLAADLTGTHHKAPVRISVTCGIELLAGQPGALPARTRSGQLIPAGLLNKWMCDSSTVRYVMTLGRKVLELSHTGRTLTATERQALDVQTGTACAAAAGHHHGGWTPGLVMEPHHVRRFADDGLTSITDTIWACPSLHHDLHTGKQTIRLKDGRLLNENGWIKPPPDSS